MPNHDSRPGPARRALLLCVALPLAACSSTSRSMFIAVNPPEAVLYVNGEAVGNGDPRPHTLEFGECERVYVQATAPNFEPRIEWYTMKQLDEMIARKKDINLTLQQR
ncbi:MAG: hypothetical protein U1E73_12665 [Planctomycetota bacterium]